MLKIKTTSGTWDRLCDQILAFLRCDTTELMIEGRPVRGFRSPDNPALWIRDHSDIIRGGKYTEGNLTSAVEAFADAQMANGRIFDYVLTEPLAHSNERENWEKWVRIQVEADVEYRFVKAAYLTWQAQSDPDWIVSLLPRLDRALTYCLTHPWRFDEEHQLLKRPYTIDTWDFDYTAGRQAWLNFQIDEHTFWGISHADNSGFYEAAMLLATLYETFDKVEAAGKWRETATSLRDRANALLFNGRFYTHFHKLTPVDIAGVDESEQLSLSTPMAVNRGLATHEIAIQILDEYQRRGAREGVFAEWFGIDPPFPDGIFGDKKLIAGAYINGGIFPLVGGELAKAALEHGREAYGVSNLLRYHSLIAESNETYLWYFPDGTPSSEETSTSPEAMPTDGWGASSMLFALVEGLAGVQDLSHGYSRVRCAPRWVAADEAHAEVDAAYEGSGKRFSYRFAHDRSARTIDLDLRADASHIDLHVLLPPGASAASLTIDGSKYSFVESIIEESRYVDAAVAMDGACRARIEYRRE